MAESTLELELGEYRGETYFLVGRARPGLNDLEEFAVTIYYNDERTEETVEIVRIDTAHDYTHIDQLYRRDEPKEALDVGFWEAIETLEENWRTYARGYERSR